MKQGKIYKKIPVISDPHTDFRETNKKMVEANA